jgi:hypothetical protein
LDLETENDVCLATTHHDMSHHDEQLYSCKDDQTSADVKVTRSGGKSESNGAMTYAFTKW